MCEFCLCGHEEHPPNEPFEEAILIDEDTLYAYKAANKKGISHKYHI
jgi:hypothetical protein